MKQERYIETIKNSIFELFVSGDEEGIRLAKELGRIIDEFEQRTTNKGPESGSNPLT